jgi:hypothetical protein
MRQKQAKNKVIGTLLDYLDNQIELFRQKNNDYPNLILLSKETKDKLFIELENEPIMDNSWKDLKNNYRGIPVEIKKDIFLELKGEDNV